MKNILFIFIFLFSLSAGFAADADWGQTGHRATGEIAQNHLTRKAKKAIEKLLNGKSLAVVSTYGDDIKSDPEYRKYGPWHYVNMEPGETKYDPATANPEGDILFALRK
ncbi:MAG TPA: S1/P1 nuclease, partial [Gillisia sp.]|nr:S1/P1 nuclease [Gillisia sp.]